MVLLPEFLFYTATRIGTTKKTVTARAEDAPTGALNAMWEKVTWSKDLVNVDVLDKGKGCLSGFVDWLGMLEREGILDEYLKT